MTNRYAGSCHSCGNRVEPEAGILERIGKKFVVWCKGCYNQSDMSGDEDRACGLRAYEDRCAEQCGR